MAIISIAESLDAPTLTSFTSLAARPGLIGRYMGALSLVQGIGRSLGPVLGGFLLDQALDGRIVWGIIGALGVLSATGYFVISRLAVFRRRTAQPPEPELPETATWGPV